MTFQTLSQGIKIARREGDRKQETTSLLVKHLQSGECKNKLLLKMLYQGTQKPNQDNKVKLT